MILLTVYYATSYPDYNKVLQVPTHLLTYVDASLTALESCIYSVAFYAPDEEKCSSDPPKNPNIWLLICPRVGNLMC